MHRHLCRALRARSLQFSGIALLFVGLVTACGGGSEDRSNASPTTAAVDDEQVTAAAAGAANSADARAVNLAEPFERVMAFQGTPDPEGQADVAVHAGAAP